ncbi:gp78 [Burkholderia pseudomallei]|uniref:AlbA family DNA-binding domain-containing protein n=1 Tax=Burkholderia pseudomallei TaxID=28450 RepID=UPI0009B548F6|nr:ATP-binding protein [Burkholderia pseudomallei]OMS31614.1 hypothetical protein AQ739_07105 [Burkholderia pseudomallei]OMS62105.1 hypothetical protein AQ742_09470 [Burkholderia pseudomallei]CAJ3021832.1 gp78 [Burkholderia pseudomallei]CAJ3061818.1 gp78 [Burkholderia pseudomallei]CAJ4311280.1 gp78 [Burkholderia pseudomallei]
MADINREYIEQLVKRPGESLVVEIKTWISPTDPTGQAKIIKGAIAMRNRGGGYLVIGFDDKTMTADTGSAPTDVRSTFHVDVIQGLVTKYASQAFEIAVEFVEYDHAIHPVIVVPPGVRTPVFAKQQLTGDGGKMLVERDVAYVRTLNSNNTPSTAKAQYKDWDELCEICFNNREADIGRFLRRHLAAADPGALREFALTLAGNGPVRESVRECLDRIMAEGLGRFQAVTQEQKARLPKHGSWEVALIIDGQFPPQSELEEFANLLSSSNPSLTGWPMWLNSRTFRDEDKRPYVFDSAWETLIIALDPNTFMHVDFMRVHPNGSFYSYRALDDDLSPGTRAPTPGTALDIILPITRVGETIAVGLSFAKALQADEQTNLQFLFRWTGLKDRVLMSWVEPGRHINPRASRQDVVTSTLTVPLDTAPTTIVEYVKAAVRPLYQVFGGFIMPDSVVEDLVQKMLARRF